MERSKIMTKNLVDGLRAKYPEQFNDLTSIECDDGWYEILSRLCYIVHSHLDYKKRINKPLESFCWSQIKEKFGGLRAYCNGADELIRGAINMAESMSYITCEATGEKGKPRKQRRDDNGEPMPAWIKTLCDEEAIKEGYV